MFSKASPENMFVYLGITFGMIFLLITPPFQAPDEPNHFFRAFQVSEFGILAQKVDDKPKIADAFFKIKKDGTIIKATAKKDKYHKARSVYEAVPVDFARKIMHYVERALETGDQQFFQFHLDNKYKYDVEISKIAEDEVLTTVYDSTTVSSKEVRFCRYH